MGERVSCLVRNDFLSKRMRFSGTTLRRVIMNKIVRGPKGEFQEHICPAVLGVKRIQSEKVHETWLCSVWPRPGDGEDMS